MVYHCLFEQSGIFKNEFIKLGFNSYDYDIENNFNQTDYVIDLFSEINNCYNGLDSIFNHFTSDDFLIIFFPCTYFSCCNDLHFKCNEKSISKKDNFYKLNYSMNRFNSLAEYYSIFCKLYYILFKFNLKGCIENPYTNNYLLSFFPFQPSLIIRDRTLMGDIYKKPTMFYSINFEFKYKIFNYYFSIKNKSIYETAGFNRSLISSEFAKNFIVTYLLD